MRPFPLFCSLALYGASSIASAQTTPDQQTPTPPSGYTLNVNSQLIVDDVSVIDRKGHAVTGLPKSAFHVFDNNLPQPDFEVQEQTSTRTANGDASPQAHMYSNAGLLRGNGTMVVILIDPMTVEIQDQMYLRIQALSFVDHLPAGTSVSIFRTNNQGIPVELQSPTSDRALIHAAVAATVPVMTRPVDNQFQNAIAEMENLSQVLRPYPGNKALFWLAGEFPLFVGPNYAGASNDIATQNEQTREAYRALQEARVAVYPIDARGVVQQGGFVTPQPMSQGAKDIWANDPSQTPQAFSQLQGDHYNEMDELAASTGGFAFYDNNAVAKVMDAALDLAQHSYAISLRPLGDTHTAAWHSLRVTVDGPYVVHYRQGYYTNDQANDSATPTSGTRNLLTAEGTKLDQVTRAEVANHNLPLQFSARVLPGAKAGKNDTVKIRYVIPFSQLTFASADGTAHSRFRMTAMAYNAWGDILGHASDVVETHYTAQQQQLAERIGVPADQSVEVHKGAHYLLLAVEDMNTKKVGTVQLPLAALTADASPTAP